MPQLRHKNSLGTGWRKLKIHSWGIVTFRHRDGQDNRNKIYDFKVYASENNAQRDIIGTYLIIFLLKCLCVSSASVANIG